MWAWQDSNLWPCAYQAHALTNWATGPSSCGFLLAVFAKHWPNGWKEKRGSKEHWARLNINWEGFWRKSKGPWKDLEKIVEARGFEPLTYSLQSYRSTNWAIPPFCFSFTDWPTVKLTGFTQACDLQLALTMNLRYPNFNFRKRL